MRTLCGGCCEEWPPDDPENCQCPDLCLYRLRIVSPVTLGPIPAFPCGERPVEFTGDLSESVVDTCFGGDSFLSSQGEISAGNLSAAISVYASGQSSDPAPSGFAPGQSFVWVKSNIRFECVNPSPFRSPPFKWLATIELEFWVIDNPYESPGDPPNDASLRLYKFLRVEIPQSCVTDGHYCVDGGPNDDDSYSTCTAPTRKFWRPDAPLTVSISSATTSLGDWQIVNPPGRTAIPPEYLAGVPYEDGDADPIRECLEAAEEAFVFEVMLTRRDNCCDNSCDCSVEPDGLIATFDGKQFTLGTGDLYTETDGEFSDTWSHVKTFGTTNTYEFLYQRTSDLSAPSSALRDEKKVTIYCDTDDTLDPPADRWFALFETICRAYEPGTGIFEGTEVLAEETKRTEIGYFVCDKSLGCDGRTQDEIIPLGEPNEIEEIDGSPETTAGTDSCEPPARPTISLAENCE